jgi:RNA polymerase sigma factor (sigma-70 family)
MNDEGEHAAKQKSSEFNDKWLVHYKRLYPYVLNLTRNKADAEDITQDALMYFKEHMEKKQWNVTIEDEDAYRRRIAHNLFTDLCKRRKREGLVSSDGEEIELTQNEEDSKVIATDDSITRIEDEIHYKQLYRALPLRAILNGLSDYELQLIRLKALGEKSYDEIAEILHKDVFRVRYDLNKLDSKLRYRVRKIRSEANGVGLVQATRMWL